MSIKYTTQQGNKYGLVNSDSKPRQLDYTEQKNYSGLVLFVGLVLVVLVVLFIRSLV